MIAVTINGMSKVSETEENHSRYGRREGKRMLLLYSGWKQVKFVFKIEKVVLFCPQYVIMGRNKSHKCEGGWRIRVRMLPLKG